MLKVYFPLTRYFFVIRYPPKLFLPQVAKLLGSLEIFLKTFLTPPLPKSFTFYPYSLPNILYKTGEVSRVIGYCCF